MEALRPRGAEQQEVEEEESQMEAAAPPVSWRPRSPMTLTQPLPRLTQCEATHVDVVHLYFSKKTVCVS